MLVKMVCPQCGANLEMEDDRDVMFCTFCGTKIANVAEKVNVNLSGKVEIDESGKIGNFLTVAKNALKAGNYSEAYNYYLRIMETDPACLEAILLKGLCAVMSSTPENIRTNEGTAAVQLAASTGLYTALNVRTISEFVSYANSLTVSYFKACCVPKRGEVMSNGEEADRHFTLAFGIVSFLCTVVKSLTPEILEGNTELENLKKNLIRSILEISDKAMDKVEYVTGYVTKEDRKGRVVTEPTTDKMKSPKSREIKDMLEVMKSEYNSIPSTVKSIQQFDEGIKQNQDVVDDYKASLQGYLSANPDIEKAYLHPGLFNREKKRAALEVNFPAELLGKKIKSADAEAQISKLNSQKSKYIKENTLR